MRLSSLLSIFVNLKALSDLSKHLMPDEVNEYLLTFPLSIISYNQGKENNFEQTMSEPSEDLKTFAVVLLGTLCGRLRGLHVRAMIPYIFEICSEKSIKLLSACAIALPRIFNNISERDDEDNVKDENECQNYRSQILSLFFDLLKSSESTPCQKICAESLEVFDPSKATSFENSLIVREKLVEMLVYLLRQGFDVVKPIAFYRVGPCCDSLCSAPGDHIFIKGLIKRDVLPFFLDASLGKEDQQFHCAYNLPGVLQCLGRDYWADDIRPCFFNVLYKSKPSDTDDGIFCESRYIRRICALCLYDLSTILGQNIFAYDLYVVFRGFLCGEENDEIRIAAMTHACGIIDCLRNEQKIESLKLLIELYHRVSSSSEKRMCETSDDKGYSVSGNWRLRYCLVEQFTAIIRCSWFSLISSSNLYREIITITLISADDPVADVNELTACKFIPALINGLTPIEKEELKREFADEDPSLTADLKSELLRAYLNSICEFASSDCFTRRQLFCSVVSSLLSQDLGGTLEDILWEKIVDSLLLLEKDPVSNVRLFLFRSLNRVQLKENHYPKTTFDAVCKVKKRLKEANESWWMI